MAAAASGASASTSSASTPSVPCWLMNAVLGGLYELPPEQILRWQSGWSRRINYAGGTRRLEPSFVPIRGAGGGAAHGATFARAEVAYVPTVLDKTVTVGADAHVHALAPVFRFDLADDDAAAAELLRGLRAYADTEERKGPGVDVSNAGGFHSKPGLFEARAAGGELRRVAAEAVAAIERHCAADGSGGGGGGVGGGTGGVDPTCGVDGGSPLEVQRTRRFAVLGLRAGTCPPESWINVSRHTNWNRLHTHEGSLWSGTFYVCVPDGSEPAAAAAAAAVAPGASEAEGEGEEVENVGWRREASGALVVKPTPHPVEVTHSLTRKEAQRLRPRKHVAADEAATSQELKYDVGEYLLLRPKVGRMYLFPGWMHHAVLPLYVDDVGEAGGAVAGSGGGAQVQTAAQPSTLRISAAFNMGAAA